MNRIERFLRKTYEQTFTSDIRFPTAAILTQGNRIISIGVNRNKTHPKQKERINYLGQCYGKHRPHAEADCLIRANYNSIAGGTLYVARRKQNADFGLAKPCKVCESLLREYEIRRVFYTINHSLLESGSWYDCLYLE